MGGSRWSGSRQQQTPTTVMFDEIKNNPRESMGSQAHEGGVKAEELANIYSHRPQPNMHSMRVMADKFDFSPTQVWFGDPGRAISGTMGWCTYILVGVSKESDVCMCVFCVFCVCQLCCLFATEPKPNRGGGGGGG